MRERGFIAEAREVQVALSDKVTKFTRVIKDPPRYGAPLSIDPWEEGTTAFKPGEFGVYREGEPIGRWGLEQVLRCPYKVGQKLWVKEVWAASSLYDLCGASDIPQYLKFQGEYVLGGDGKKQPTDLYYRADYAGDGDPEWRYPKELPKWASRLSLIVKSVKAEERRMAGWLWVFDCEKVDAK